MFEYLEFNMLNFLNYCRMSIDIYLVKIFYT